MIDRTVLDAWLHMQFGANKTKTEILAEAKRLGYKLGRDHLNQFQGRHGYVCPPGPRPSPEIMAALLEWMRYGMTDAEAARQSGCYTRERVRQLRLKHGILKSKAIRALVTAHQHPRPAVNNDA